jgi:hypothetical protein
MKTLMNRTMNKHLGIVADIESCKQFYLALSKVASHLRTTEEAVGLSVRRRKLLTGNSLVVGFPLGGESSTSTAEDYYLGPNEDVFDISGTDVSLLRTKLEGIVSSSAVPETSAREVSLEGVANSIRGSAITFRTHDVGRVTSGTPAADCTFNREGKVRTPTICFPVEDHFSLSERSAVESLNARLTLIFGSQSRPVGVTRHRDAADSDMPSRMAYIHAKRAKWARKPDPEASEIERSCSSMASHMEEVASSLFEKTHHAESALPKRKLSEDGDALTERSVTKRRF